MTRSAKEIEAAIIEARRAEFQIVDGPKFIVLVPMAFDWRAAYSAVKAETGQINDAAGQRRIVVGAIAGWSGIRESDLGLPGDDEVPFDPSLKGMVVDLRQDWSDELILYFLGRKREEEAKWESARKNSSRASTGN